MDETTVVVIVLATCGGLAIALLFLMLKRRQDEVAAVIDERFRTRDILRRAPVFLVAQQSRGLRQRQGTGTLILTSDELFVAIVMPRITLSIALNRITTIERTARMCGQQPLGREFLRIEFTDSAGVVDALGLRVKDPDAWREATDAERGESRR